MKKNLLEIINKITIQFIESSPNKRYDIAEKLEQSFEEYLQSHPQDSKMWIKLALFVYNLPLADDFKAINCLKTVLIFDHNNYQAVLLLGYIKEFLCYIDDELFHTLCKLITHDNEIASMIEYEKFFYYRYKQNKELIEQSLLKSISLYDKHVWNNIDLGRFYLSNKQFEKAKQYITNGFNNIQYVYQSNDFRNGKLDPIDVEEFFNERLKGIHLSCINYDILKEQYDLINTIY